MNTIKTYALLASLLLLITAGCGASHQPAEDTISLWFGIPVPTAAWEVVGKETDGVRLGTIEHRSLPGCRLTIMTDDPFYLAGYPAGWEGTWERLNTPMLNVDRITVRDGANALRMLYYDVFDGTGSGLGRLTYFEAEWGTDAAQCTDAIEVLLMTIDPNTFPELPVAQG